MRIGRFTAQDSDSSADMRRSELEAQLQIAEELARIADALERMDK